MTKNDLDVVLGLSLKFSVAPTKNQNPAAQNLAKWMKYDSNKYVF